MHRSLAALLALAAATFATGQPAFPAALRVLAYETPPFFYPGADGKPTGIEYEILQYFAKAKGEAVEVIWTDDFEGILPRLARGEADVAASTLTITTERRQLVGFSAPYFPTRVMLVERKGDSTRRLEQLAGATLATIRGTTYEQLMASVPRATLVYGAVEEDLLKLVASGGARAAAADSVVALTLLPRYPGLRLGIPLSPEQGFGFAVRKGSPLERELTTHIQQLKSSQIYFRILEKHLGAEAARLVAAGKS